jgi:hypothetical protein
MKIASRRLPFGTNVHSVDGTKLEVVQEVEEPLASVENLKEEAKLYEMNDRGESQF